MNLPFTKYQGTGNDFIIIDNRELSWNPTSEQVALLCDRHWGIGADGLMLLSSRKGFDFSMRYFNSDGNESSMCGNGGRCMVAEAARLGLIAERTIFSAVDGEHEAVIIRRQDNITEVRLKMVECSSHKQYPDGLFLSTGSPHFVVFTEDVNTIDVYKEGRSLRSEARFGPDGTNVDFVAVYPGFLKIRTYERGVENETLSCGTGATAAALASALADPTNSGVYKVLTRGGELKVSFLQTGGGFSDIWLEGPANYVFSGEITVNDP